MKHSKKRFLSITKSPCGLGKSQVKDAKGNHTYSKPKHHKTFKEEEKTIKKRCKQEIAKPKWK